MTRFLSTLILCLHIIGDARRRFHIGATTLLLLAGGTIITASTVAADAAGGQGLKYKALPQKIAASIHMPAAVAALTQGHHQDPTLSAAGKHHQAPTSSPTLALAPVPANLSGQTSSNAASGQASGQPADTPLTPNQPATDTTPSQSNVAATIQLGQTHIECRQAGQWLNIHSAQIALAMPASADETLLWRWETKPDTTASDNSPVSANQVSQTITANTTTVTIAPTDPSQPLLSAPESSKNGYSVRLHITSPFDASSTWESVPASSGPCT